MLKDLLNFIRKKLNKFAYFSFIFLPLLIAITALSRFIILQDKEVDPSGLVYEAVAIVLISLAIVILRLRHSDKLGIKPK